MKLRDILTKRLGPMPLSGWLTLVLVIAAAGVLRDSIWPTKTNRSYLIEVIETGMLQKTANKLIAKTKLEIKSAPHSDADWARIEKGLSGCMAKEANNFLASEDPYLALKADKSTPVYLAKRFLDACDAAGPAPTSPTIASSGEIYLFCNLYRPDGTGSQISFAYDPGKSTLYSVDRGANYRVDRNTSTELWANLETMYSDFPPTATATAFRLNRITGAASVDFLHKPTEPEIEICKKRPGTGALYCDMTEVLTAYAQSGRCAVVDRAVK